MSIAFNNTLLRVSVSALARALYQLDLDSELECCPSKISQLLSEQSNGITRSNIFDIPTMELLFRDSVFKYIFKKFYVINCTFPIKKRYSSNHIDYYLLIGSSRVDIITNLSERWELRNSDMNEFVSKFTTNFVKDYNERISYLTELDLKNIKIKEEIKQKQIEDIMLLIALFLLKRDIVQIILIIMY